MWGGSAPIGGKKCCKNEGKTGVCTLVHFREGLRRREGGRCTHLLSRTISAGTTTSTSWTARTTKPSQPAVIRRCTRAAVISVRPMGPTYFIRRARADCIPHPTPLMQGYPAAVRVCTRSAAHFPGSSRRSPRACLALRIRLVSEPWPSRPFHRTGNVVVLGYALAFLVRTTRQ